MNHLTSESVELADRCRLRLADPRLSYQVARLYSQHTRLGANEAGLRSWTRAESTDRLDDAVRLIDAGLVLRRAGRETYRDCLRRAGELREWVVWETVGALAVLCGALGWEDESRLGRALEKMRAVASVLAPATDRFSWLLAKLSAEAAGEYASCSLRALLGELRARLSSTGR